MIRTILVSNVSLWGCLWQSTLFAVLGLAGGFLLRRRPARAHQVLLLAMLGAVLVPALSGMVRHFHLGLWTRPAVVPELVGPSNPVPIETGTFAATTATEAPPTRRAPSPAAPSDDAGSGAAHVAWRAIALWSWAAAACVLFGRLLFAFGAGVHLARHAQPVSGGPVVEALRLAQARLGVHKDLQIRKDARVRSPVIWCWGRRPALLVPDGVSGPGGGTDWAGVIAHELAHWKRGDHVSGLLAELVVCALPWNPLLWLSKRHLVSLTEQACDDWVMASGQPAEDYAESLLGFRAQNRMAFVPAIVRGKRGVAFRVRRILNDACGNPRTGTRWAVGVTVLVVCTALGLAFAQARPADLSGPQKAGRPAQSDQPAVAGQRMSPVRLDAASSQIAFTGRVIDAQGTPVVGAKATLYLSDYDESAGSLKTELLTEKTTGIDGTFTFAVAKRAELSPAGFVLVRKEGLALNWTFWPLQSDRRIDITLGQGKELSGDVVDEKGEPIPEAEVSLSVSAWPLPVKTDDRGHFVFENMPVGTTFEFQAKKAGRAVVRTFDPASRGGKGQFSPGQSGIKIILPPEAIIQGIAVEKVGGKPVAGTTVMAVPTSRGMIPGLSEPPGADGVFRIRGLCPGTYSVQLFIPRRHMLEWVAEPVPVSLEAGQTKGDVTLELTKGAIIEVLVKDGDGKPVAQATALLAPVNGGRSFQPQTDTSGLAQVRVTPGQYTFSGASKSGYGPLRLQPLEQFDLADGQTKRIEYVLGSGPKTPGVGGIPRRIPIIPGTPRITGIVRDEAGHPLAGVQVQVVPWVRNREEIRTDASGRFEIPADPRPSTAPPRPPVLVAWDVAHNLAGSTEIGKTEGDLELTLQPGLTVTGTVLSEEGQPLAGGHVTVMLRPTPHSLLQLNRELIAIGADGTFEVKTLPADRPYTITALADGYGRRSVEVNPQDSKDHRYDAGPLKLPLAKLSITGVVVDPNDKPVAGAFIVGGGEGQPALHTQTDAEGKFTIQSVCPGPISLTVNSRGPRPMSAMVPAEGGATDLRIVVHPWRTGQLSVPGGPQR